MKLLCALLCTFVACDGAASTPLGQVSIALSEDVCADYCLAAVRATVFFDGALDLPLGPALQATCGTRLTMPALPAGQRVVVQVQAFDVTGALLLTGRSEAVTIVADSATAATVQLTPTLTPTLTTITPEPVVAGTPITLEGAFGPRLGQASVEVADTSLTIDAWLADRITTTALVTGPLVVRQCGVTSPARELRVIPPALGSAPVARPPCADAALTAAVVAPDGVLTAWSCGPTGIVSTMHLDESICPLDPGAAWTLPSPPRAIASRGQPFVGGAGLWRLDPDGIVTTLADTPITALAASTRRVVAISATVSSVDGDPIVGLDLAGLTPLALTGTPDGVFMTASVGAEGRLVHLPDSGVVATYALVGATRCDAPTALTADAQRVVMACAQGGLGLWHIATRTLTTIDGRVFDAVALDDSADVAFAGDPDGLSTIDLGVGLLSHHATPGRLLATLGAHRLLTSAPTVLTPYSEVGPCAP